MADAAAGLLVVVDKDGDKWAWDEGEEDWFLLHEFDSSGRGLWQLLGAGVIPGPQSLERVREIGNLPANELLRTKKNYTGANPGDRIMIPGVDVPSEIKKKTPKKGGKDDPGRLPDFPDPPKRKKDKKKRRKKKGKRDDAPDAPDDDDDEPGDFDDLDVKKKKGFLPVLAAGIGLVGLGRALRKR